MPDTYFVLSASEDGLNISTHTKDALEKKLNDKWWGEKQVFHDKIPPGFPDRDLGIVIIKGQVVMPKPVTVVTKLEL
jgi:hypothetical protein